MNNSASTNENKSLSGEGEIICINCGLTTTELMYNGRPGCPHCYKYFYSVFNTLSQNNNIKKYSGKIPVNYVEILTFQTVPAVNKSWIETFNSETKLEEELKRAVIEERYEDAAKLRDKLQEVIKSE